MNTLNTTVMTEMSTTYAASAPMAANPRRATSGNVSANTPIGATTNSQRTRTSIASAMPRKSGMTLSRVASGNDTSASPSSMEKTISGSIAPSTAALMGFDGTSDVNHCDGVCSALVPSPAAAAGEATLARTLATAAGFSVSLDNTGGETTAPTSPAATRRTTKTTMPRPPTRATTAPLLDVAIPTTRLATTSGITVMRIPFTNNVPTGSTAATTARATDASVVLKKRPTAIPAASASRTRVESDTRQR